MKEELKVLFYLKKNQAKTNGLCPVMGRISIGKTMAQFGTKLEADATKRDAKAGRSTGKTAHEVSLPPELQNLSSAIEGHYTKIAEKDGNVTAERVKNAVMGIAKEPTTLLKRVGRSHLRSTQSHVPDQPKTVRKWLSNEEIEKVMTIRVLRSCGICLFSGRSLYYHMQLLSRKIESKYQLQEP